MKPCTNTPSSHPSLAFFLSSRLQADLFGDVAEAKEAAEFAGAYKEAKKCRAYETYQLLASIISFGDRIAELLTTVQVRGGCGCGWGGVEKLLGANTCQCNTCQHLPMQHLAGHRGAPSCPLITP
jgi:hypothetical protein